MVKFRMSCPDCSTQIIAASPRMMMWEACPGCGVHRWDIYDAMMAETYKKWPFDGIEVAEHVQN
jgi:Zn finger protein HypA/HybF involved in hydrogenase expression